jgi:hypothetical protein
MLVPFPQTSNIAARWLRSHDLNRDLICIDASHNEEVDFRDSHSYGQMAAAGGIMFGDDYDQYWSSVRSIVCRFSQLIGVIVTNEDGKWAFRGPVDRQPSSPGGDQILLRFFGTEAIRQVVGDIFA